MFFILGLAAAVLALAVIVGQVQGRNPAFCRGPVGWLLSIVMILGAVGLVAIGRNSAVSDRREKQEAVERIVIESEKEVAAQAKSAAVGKKAGKKGSKKGGRKKGGWGRRSFSPPVPLTPERAKRIEDLTQAGAMLQTRGGQVTRVQLAGPKVTDEHLALLDGLSGTRSFVLSAPQVSQAGLAPVATMTGLTTLDLTGTPMTDETIVHLSGMERLTTLNLTNQPITDAAAVVLAKLTNLRTLDLTNTGLTDMGVARLAGLKSLTRLVLSGTKVGDDGIGALVDITGLKQLEISHTQAGDGVVDHLLKFRDAELFWLTRGENGVSDKAIRRIRVDLPTCVVRYSPVPLKK